MGVILTQRTFEPIGRREGMREGERAQHKLAKMVVIIAINRYVTDTTPSSDSKKD